MTDIALVSLGIILTVLVYVVGIHTGRTAERLIALRSRT
jgi:hypothetical protein